MIDLRLFSAPDGSMSTDGPSVTGKRWFHTLVVVGASLTGVTGCGKLKASPDAATVADSGSSTEGDGPADAPGDAEVDGAQGVEAADSGPGTDAGVEVGPDAIADAKVEFPLVLIL